MFKQILYASTILFLSCSYSPSDRQSAGLTKNSPKFNQVTLSHVKAYLLLGDIEKAEQLLQTIKSSEPNAKTMLTLAELQAAKGNSVEAQRMFLLALSDSLYDAPLNKNEISENLLDYFCAEKKWPALEGYASALVVSSNNNNTQSISPSKSKSKNNALTQIGLCFFDKQHFDQAQKWLQQLDVNQQIDPQAHLALARIAVEKNKISIAQESINQYEATKTKIDAKILWTTFEVYQALKQPEIAAQTGEYLYSLFPYNEHTRKYILTTKREERTKLQQQETMALLETNNLVPEPPSPALEESFHIMKKGETLYQLSKRYGVTIPELQSWNPSLVIDEISVGTKIRITRS